MHSLLIEKTAVVTGAAGGIGLEIAKEFAREGAAVIISDVNEQAGKEAAARLKDEGCEAVSITCDVTMKSKWPICCRRSRNNSDVSISL